MRVAVGLGGNLPGTLEAFGRVRSVFERLWDEPRFSSIYQTAPQMDTDQEPFWNAAASGHWGGTPEGLLERLLILEAGEGRLRDPQRPKGPRVLDLDLLWAEGVVRSSARLTLPHGFLGERRFALEPLAEVEPYALDPSGTPWRDRLGGLAGQGVDRTGLKW